MTDYIDLKPCPFCGSKFTQVCYLGGKWQEPSAFDSGYRGECCDCGAITAAYATEAEAAEAWNTRTDEGTYWHELFGTPKRAAVYFAMQCFGSDGSICCYCPFDSCDEGLRNMGTYSSVRDKMLEWLEGDAR